MAKKSPVQRTTAELRKEGFEDIAVVERFFPRDNPNAMPGDPPRKYDLFGFADLLCFRFWPVACDDEQAHTKGATRFVQVCGPGQFAAHYRKMTGTQKIAGRIQRWLKCGNEVQLWEWRELKKNPRSGDGKTKWEPRVHNFSLADFKLDSETS